MADFRTHVSFAATTSGLLATLYLGAEIITPTEVMILWAAGTLGGILPDIDADNSIAIKTIFNIFGVVFSFLIMFSQTTHLSIVELWSLWILSYLLIRFPMMELFKKFTIHRGIYHSVLMAVFFWFASTTLTFHFLGQDESMAWMVGFFVFWGYMVHLSLDELYSVDFANKKLKRSAGTALKLLGNDSSSNVVFIAATVGLYWYAIPTPDAFIGLLFNLDTYINVWDNLLPKKGWFYYPHAG